MTETATVELLTAEVRVLMVGARQVTLSVARQLDDVVPSEITPFGRIQLARKLPFAVNRQIEVIGSADGALAVSHADLEWNYCDHSGRVGAFKLGSGAERNLVRCKKYADDGSHQPHTWLEWDFADEARLWETLPLIVLAGLR